MDKQRINYKAIEILKVHGTLISLFVMIVGMTIINPIFISKGSILNVLNQMTINGFIAFGMTFVIISGGIDLSVGSMLALIGFILGKLINLGVSEFVVLPVVIVFGILLGCFNGIIIGRLHLQPFIMTLATMTMFRGITYIISRAIPESNLNVKAPFFDFLSQGKIIGIPMPTILLGVAFILLFIILHKTIFGKSICAIGGNEEVAKLCGIAIVKLKVAVYGISGLMTSIAAILLTSRLSSAQPTAGLGFELDAIAAVVIGGTRLSGGKGRVYGTLLGILIIAFLKSGLNIIGVSVFYQDFVKGFVILLAVILDSQKK